MAYVIGWTSVGGAKWHSAAGSGGALSEAETTLTVTLKDPRGAVAVRAGDLRYAGEITDAPATLAIGQRLSMALEAEGGSPFEGLVEVLGRVSDIEGGVGSMPNTPLFGGLVLTFEVARMTRSALPWLAEEAATVEHTLDLSTLKSGVESKVFKLRPVVASLDLMSAEDEGDGPRNEYADTVMAPPPLMSLPSEEGEPAREPTGVIGTLRMISIAEVVQGLEMGRKTARIEVRVSEDAQGRIFVEQGQVVHAEVGEATGEEAFFLMARCTSGTYRVSFDRTVITRTIDKPTAYVILEAMRRIDEQQRDADLALEAADLEEVSGAPELSREGEPADGLGERIPTVVREQVVEALDRVFDLASVDEDAIIDVDEELVIEEVAAPGEPRIELQPADTLIGLPSLEGTADSAPPSDPEDVPVFTPAHIKPLDSQPDGSPVFDVQTGDIAPVTDVDVTLKGGLGSFSLPAASDLEASKEASDPPVPTPADRAASKPPEGKAKGRRGLFGRGKKAGQPKAPLVFSGFFDEAREVTNPGSAPPADDQEDNPAAFTSLDAALAFLQTGEGSTSDISGEAR